MHTYQGSKSRGTQVRSLSSARARAADRAAGRPTDDGLTLVEVMVAFTVLLIALIPLSYLFTTSLTQAGQARNQLTAMSLAEKYVEILSNVTPPVNANGEVIVDRNAMPQGPGSTTASAATIAAGPSLGTLTVASTSTLPAASGSSPMYAVVTTSAGPQTITYTGQTATTLTGITGWTSTGTISSGALVVQATPSETEGGVTYNLNAEYEWTSVQNGSTGSTTASAATIAAGTPPTLATVTVASTANFVTASVSSPQQAKVTTSAGVQIVSYSGQTATTLTGVTGWTSAGTIANGATVVQRVLKPNLCTSGTPQLLKLRMTVSWGPNADANNVQDSEVLNYPPAGIQTLGFIALQLSGDSTAADSQGNPWSERVQAPPVTITGAPQTLTIYPDSYGCAFAQVPAGTYTVSVGNASSGIPAGSTYGSPSFVANGQAGGSATYTGKVLNPTVAESQSGVPVSIGAVTNLVGTYPTAFPGYDQGSIVNLSYPSSTATDDGVACPGLTGITCISSGQNSTNGAVLTLANGATWTTAALPAGVTRITSVACAGNVECEAVGYGGGHGVIVDITPGLPPTVAFGTGTTALLTGTTALSQIVCPSASNCVAIGTTTAGAAAVFTDTITAGVDSWTADTITGTGTIAGLANLTCPASSGGCIATGTSTSPTSGTPVIVSGGFGLGWAATSPNPAGVTLTGISSLACPTTATITTCLVAGGTATGSALASGTATLGLGFAAPAWAWTADTLPVGTSTTGTLTCPTSSKCLLTGRSTTAPTMMYGAISAIATFYNDTLPAISTNAISVLTQMVCPSATQCVMIGAAGALGTVPAILPGTISAGTTALTPDTWTSFTPTVTGTLSQLGQVNCPSATSCAATGVGTNASSLPSAFLLSSSGGVASGNWSQNSLPTANPAVYLSDIDCTTSGSPTYCSTVGASTTRAVELASSSGPSGSWADQTPSGLSGYADPGVPVEINNTGLLPTTYVNEVQAGAASNITQLPDLYPFVSGYGLFAGDCSAELGTGQFNVSQASTVPGGTSSATVPLGLVVVQALHASGTSVGLPYSGATVTLTATTSGCNGDVYTLPAAGPDGLSRAEVPYGQYTLSVTGGVASTEAITVGGNSLTAPAGIVLFPNPITMIVS
jgi:Tfp pilus assembly protein PilV